MYNDFLLVRPFPSPEKFRFYTDMIVSIEWLNLLPRLGVSVIVSRFTSFTENFVICCCQLTKVFCSRHCITSAFPARSLCNFGSLAHFAVSVLSGIE